MSGSRVKKMRIAFEVTSGFTILERGTSKYKTFWRKFKKNVKEKRRKTYAN